MTLSSVVPPLFPYDYVFFGRFKCSAEPLPKPKGFKRDSKLSRPSASRVYQRFVGVFFALCVVNLVCAIDATILAVALPVCIRDLFT
jgi:hypothetical protein